MDRTTADEPSSSDSMSALSSLDELSESLEMGTSPTGTFSLDKALSISFKGKSSSSPSASSMSSLSPLSIKLLFVVLIAKHHDLFTVESRSISRLFAFEGSTSTEKGQYSGVEAGGNFSSIRGGVKGASSQLFDGFCESVGAFIFDCCIVLMPRYYIGAWIARRLFQRYADIGDMLNLFNKTAVQNRCNHSKYYKSVAGALSKDVAHDDGRSFCLDLFQLVGI